MPLIDVTYDSTVSDLVLRRLTDVLPDVIAQAVECPEEPWVGPPAPGDIEIRFRPKGPIDVGTLNCVIEVRTKLFASRLSNKHERAELIRARLAESVAALGALGVWLILCEGAWSQT